MQQQLSTIATYRRKLRHLQRAAINSGLSVQILKQYDKFCDHRNKTVSKTNRLRVIAKAVIGFLLVLITTAFLDSFFSSRCLLPSNYFVWEATRPVADCSYCENVTKPVILRNITRQDFTVSYTIALLTNPCPGPI